MKITKVKYSRLISDHNYNNQSFGAEAEVGPDETPEDARADLVLWVDGILEKRGLLREQADEKHEPIADRQSYIAPDYTERGCGEFMLVLPV